VAVGLNVENVLSLSNTTTCPTENKNLGGAQFNDRGTSLQLSFIIKMMFIFLGTRSQMCVVTKDAKKRNKTDPVISPWFLV
jgi:hypothetical protein